MVYNYPLPLFLSLKLLNFQVKFKFKFHIQPDGAYGSFKNGQWTGKKTALDINLAFSKFELCLSLFHWFFLLRNDQTAEDPDGWYGSDWHEHHIHQAPKAVNYTKLNTMWYHTKLECRSDAQNFSFYSGKLLLTSPCPIWTQVLCCKDFAYK